MDTNDLVFIVGELYIRARSLENEIEKLRERNSILEAAQEENIECNAFSERSGRDD